MKIIEIANFLKNAIKSGEVKSVLIFSHHRPDGDTIGASTALALALDKMGVENKIVCDSLVPQKYSFIKGVEKFSLPEKVTKKYDLHVSVDCSVESMIGNAYTLYTSNKKTINIDHHISNSKYALYNHVEITGACCEILYKFIKLLGVEIDNNIADSLALGIVTDTGNFGHSNVTSQTMQIVSSLVDLGANLHVITEKMFRTQTKERAKLYALAISNMRYMLDGKLTVLTISLSDLAKTGADSSMTEGFIDYALSIDTAEVAISILQVNEKTYKISLRSKGKVNVNEIASLYGGGGHILASGVVMNGYLEDIIDKLSYNVKQRL